jgi:Flp pilus assembly protein TadD
MLALRGRAGDHAESDSLLGAALVTYRTTLGDEHPAVAYVYHAFGVLEERRGDLDEAERRFRQAAAIRRGSARDNPRVTVETLLALGRIQLRRNAADAVAILQEADALAAERLDEDDPVRVEAAAALAGIR